MGAFLALLRKDLILEVRQREASVTLIFLAVLLSAVSALGVQNSFLEPSAIQKLAPALFWTVFILTASVTIGKTSEYDLQLGAIDGVLLSGVPLALVFVAKVISNFIIVMLAQVVMFGVFALLLNIAVGDISLLFMVLSAAVVLAYASLLTLLSGMASASRLRTLLVPLVALPLLFPLFFCALEISGELFATRNIAWDSGWVSLLLGLDVVYFVLGVNLYEYVIRE